MFQILLEEAIQETEGELNFMVLGSGNLHLEYVLKE
jgi:hypothetical protein